MVECLYSNSFDEVINDKDKTSLVVFMKKNCHVCKEVINRLDELTEYYDGKIYFYQVDIEEDKELFKRFPLKGVPSLLFFQAGQFKGKLAGKLDDERIRKKIDELL